MGSIGFWNVRGMNNENKQKDFRWFLHNNNVGVFGLLETRVRFPSINKVHQGIGSEWAMVNNIDSHDGGRIWIIWDETNYKVEVLSSEAQVINARVIFIPTGEIWWISMVYGFNRVVDRLPLWHSLQLMHQVVAGPWVVMGDFNSVLAMDERIGSEISVAEMRDFQDCVDNCGIGDIPAHGAFFTWNNKQDVGDVVFSRIDRAMVNDEWLIKYPDTLTMFHPEGLFDHCPCTMALKPDGRPLKELNGASFAQIETTARLAHLMLQEAQTKLQLDPRNVSLQREARDATLIYKDRAEAKRSFLAQKAKVQWLSEGDGNTKFFHSAIKARRMQNKILAIKDMDGKMASTALEIEEAFIHYYQKLLGACTPVTRVHIPTVRKGSVVNLDQRNILTAEVTSSEIKEALDTIPPNKAPGPDGFTSQFFKDAYEVVGNDLIEAVQEFFNSGKMLKQVNATTLTLIPKKVRPESVADFRPIACCNVIYKVISKVICNRLARVLPSIVSENQSAFIKGRDIVDNILICQDLVRLYKRKSCSPRCLMKIDLKKAYDSIEWEFVKQMMKALKFPRRFILWVMECISTPWFTLSLNGNSFGYFQGKRGIRQGDPMSPLLFTLCMEYLSRILAEVTSTMEFSFHPLCRPLSLTHLCFADDLLMFCRGDRGSITVLLRAFATFSKASGLVMNCEKSDIYFNGVRAEEVHYILNISGFREGSLPFRIERICRNYLWGGSEQFHKIPNVAWEKICCDKKYGGLGIVHCRKWNMAMMGKFVWWLVSKADHMWIKWVNHIYIKGQEWLSYIPPVQSSWSWRMICKTKEILKDGFYAGEWTEHHGYSVAHGYHWLQGPKDKVSWCPLIWNKLNLPKHSFIGWLAVQHRLLTKDRLMQFGIITDGLCDLCMAHPETHQHWRCRSLMKKHIVFAAILAMIYHIWQTRNFCRFDLLVPKPEVLIARVKTDVQLRGKNIIWGTKFQQMKWLPWTSMI
ncbi:uncharacterized protein LOC141641002 [Silene latifolia]|uniref:uncharacterized protein LOC141641002 n=1 Tax=Silene latifolia TaxID=37657 RepID=UPI003D782ED3